MTQPRPRRIGGCSAGEVPSTLALYCAYHENTSLSPMLLYADDPFVVGNPGCDDGNHPNGPRTPSFLAA